jgi:hypothetical protein
MVWAAKMEIPIAATNLYFFRNNAGADTCMQIGVNMTENMINIASLEVFMADIL